MSRRRHSGDERYGRFLLFCETVVSGAPTEVVDVGPSRRRSETAEVRRLTNEPVRRKDIKCLPNKGKDGKAHYTYAEKIKKGKGRQIHRKNACSKKVMKSATTTQEQKSRRVRLRRRNGRFWIVRGKQRARETREETGEKKRERLGRRRSCERGYNRSVIQLRHFLRSFFFSPSASSGKGWGGSSCFLSLCRPGARAILL